MNAILVSLVLLGAGSKSEKSPDLVTFIYSDESFFGMEEYGLLYLIDRKDRILLVAHWERWRIDEHTKLPAPRWEPLNEGHNLVSREALAKVPRPNAVEHLRPIKVRLCSDDDWNATVVTRSMKPERSKEWQPVIKQVRAR